MYRQGDILIFAASETEILDAQTNGQPVERENGQLIVAYGESSGHSHAIREDQVEMYRTEQGQYIRAAVPFVLTHEEHGAIQIPAGTFRVVRQREYTPRSIRNIAD
jgi:hypothetical protein